MPRTRRTARTADGDRAIGHSTCTLPVRAEPEPKAGFPFRLRTDRVVPDATGPTGPCRRPAGYDGTTSCAREPEAENNGAEVLLGPVRWAAVKGPARGSRSSAGVPGRPTPPSTQ